MPARRARRRRAATQARPPPARPLPRPWVEPTFCRGEWSCAFAHPLAQQSRRAENEHQNEHEEGENVLVIAAEHAHLAVTGRTLLLQRIGKKRESANVGCVTDIPRAERLDDAEQDSAQHCAGEITD